MPRRKLSEYRAKSIITSALKVPYEGWSVRFADLKKDLKNIPRDERHYVVKVDQAVKGRFKKGLVMLDVKRADIQPSIEKLAAHGYQYFIVEPHITHAPDQERYLSMAQTREGLTLSYSSKGGVDIESHPESITTQNLDDTANISKIASQLLFEPTALRALIDVFESGYFTLVEINPYIVNKGDVTILDSAVEVDDAGQPFTSAWKNDDIRESGFLSEQEKVVRDLNKKSAASFSLSIINPDGALFLLLSGGGASIVIADEAHNNGMGKLLANYGEYSGNPAKHEAQKYASQVLDLIISSKAKKKVLFIGGAVANFTDIAATFAGIIDALEEKASQLKKQHLTVHVRRGGPNQEEGLKNIEQCLRKLGIYGGVYSPTTSIPDALSAALKDLK